MKGAPVLYLNKDGELQIPHDLRTGALSTLLGMEAMLLIGDGVEQNRINRRRDNSYGIILDPITPRQQRYHHYSTFLPEGRDLRGLLNQEKRIEVSDKGVLILPDSIKTLFSDTNLRARLLLLKGEKDTHDGFAVSFQRKFPVGSNGRI